jgi:hypothetical protein
MRRDEIIRAFENVRRALQQAKIYSVINSSLRRSSKAEIATGPALQAYATFMTAYATFGDAEKRILEVLKLTPILNPEFWSKLTVGPDGPSNISVDARNGAMLARDFFPAFEQLLLRESDTATLSFETAEKPGPVEAQRIRFFVREPGSPSVTVKHFSEILKAIDNLYGAIETIYELPQADLVVGAMDSGSDKELDIFGIAKAVKILSDTLLECWNRYRTAKALDTSVTYKTAVEGIGLLEKLRAAEGKQSISPEAAESLRRTIVKSIDDLFSNGVYTDAMEGQPNLVPSSLPVERRRLLTHSASSDPTVDGDRLNGDEGDEIDGNPD